MKHGQNMMLLTTYWGEDKTFKLMPITPDCPFTEVLYDPKTDMLVAISNNPKTTLQMVPKLDDNGNAQKASKPRDNGKSYKEKQVQMELLQEFYFTERDEAISFVEMFAVNAKDYDYKKFFTSLEEQFKDKIITDTPSAGAPLLDKNGVAMKVEKGPTKVAPPKKTAKKATAKK
jgi:hypothetical protein